MAMRMKHYFFVQGILAAVVCGLQAFVALGNYTTSDHNEAALQQTALPFYVVIALSVGLASMAQATITSVTSILYSIFALNWRAIGLCSLLFFVSVTGVAVFYTPSFLGGAATFIGAALPPLLGISNAIFHVLTEISNHLFHTQFPTDLTSRDKISIEITLLALVLALVGYVVSNVTAWVTLKNVLDIDIFDDTSVQFFGAFMLWGALIGLISFAPPLAAFLISAPVDLIAAIIFMTFGRYLDAQVATAYRQRKA
jgi:hypothetical protein